MFRILLIFLTILLPSLIESVRIEYPSNPHIEERIRKDLDSINPIFPYYIIPREIQFNADAIKNNLPYFLRCKGSKNSIQFKIPTSATNYLSLDTDYQTQTITAKLPKNQLTSDLIGRYTCSEMINDQLQETTVYVFIQDGRSVFTKTIYPKIFKQTGIHFFNLPCQTTSWYPRISCPSKSCNTPVCDRKDLCIPVYYTPANVKAEKVFFDPQIGFALENPTISNGLSHFTCMGNYTPSQESVIPFESLDRDYVEIHQRSFTVMKDERVRLSCEIRFGTEDERKIPVVFWFEDIHNLELVSNQTEKPVVNPQTKLYSRNSSIILEKFKPGEVYRFYCVRVSDHGLYSCSIDITCDNGIPYLKFGLFTAIVVIISILLLILLIIFAIKYFRMKRDFADSVIRKKQAVGIEDPNQPALIQLDRIPLPDNFASQHQIRTFLSSVNGDNLPILGRGQFGVVYQVSLPDVGLVAAKTLPETIRDVEHRRNKRNYLEENEEMISMHEIRKKTAVGMLIDEMKLMHKAGKHVNIVALKKVAYPVMKFRCLCTGGPIRDEDSFYLMELCSNGSLESMLKCFDQPSSSSGEKLSLYETLSEPTKPEMTVTQAYEQCALTDDDLKLIAYQVACGVAYLNKKQIFHCDIASRNILVTPRFIMKICDFGLATSTAYKNYREQLAKHEGVQLERRNSEIVTHNLTPELARAILRASTADEQLALIESSIKSDVWSFGIFLWTLFFKCRIRPFDKLLQEMGNNSDGESFFHRLARIISDGRVLRYIYYQPEIIPRNIYEIIRKCLVEENDRPEMTRIQIDLCHSTTLSERAFQYYRSEYDRYQEENATDGNFERFAEEQGVNCLPSFAGDNSTDEIDYSEQEQDSSLILPKKNSLQTTTQSNFP